MKVTYSAIVHCLPGEEGVVTNERGDVAARNIRHNRNVVDVVREVRDESLKVVCALLRHWRSDALSIAQLLTRHKLGHRPRYAVSCKPCVGIEEQDDRVWRNHEVTSCATTPVLLHAVNISETQSQSTCKLTTYAFRAS